MNDIAALLKSVAKSLIPNASFRENTHMDSRHVFMGQSQSGNIA